MRYIDQDDIKLPDGWLDKARVARDAVAAGKSPDDYDHIWRELKDALANLFPEKKCWYCESPVDRSDNAVDHFRPKGRVSDATSPHNGYRWLAFEPNNFRYSCTFCNSRRKDVVNGTAGGKADRFPLLNELGRLYGPGPLRQERPELLDPCQWGDWELLGCKHENGKPCATGSDPVGVKRANTSIDILHLDYLPTCNRRHAAAVQLIANVDQAKRLFLKAQTDSDMEIEFTEVARKIRKTIDRKSDFSGEMIFILRGQRHANHPWIQQLLEA